jgi:DNA-directed RNA polymerase specialized sigma24 family protein
MKACRQSTGSLMRFGAANRTENPLFFARFMDESSVELLAKYRKGDEQAADELFRRYVSRLTVLARARIARKIARRFDAEDVVLSAYRSFFVRAREGQFSLARSGDLWRLLVGIVLKKLYHQAAHHTADRRSIDREQPLPDGGDSAWNAFPTGARSPTPEEAVTMAELVEGFMAQLEPLSRQVVELRLQDWRLVDIAAATLRSERTVRRILNDVRLRLESLLEPDLGAAEVDRFPRRSAGEWGDHDSEEDAGPPDQANNDGIVPGSRASPEAFLSDRDFVLQLHLGTGGTGKVYRALRRADNKAVAVKVLKKAIQNDLGAVRRFLDEALTVARLSHAGIVGVHGIGRTRSGGYFLVQELVAGQSLSQLADSRRIEVGEAVRWVAEAAEAIDFAHRHGVVHCDLKPANLLLDQHGHLRVTDFGLAQIVAPGARTRTAIAGTAGYMAPEQLDPQWGKISPATDIFGLGAVLFALLVGHPPFTGKSREELLRSILETGPNLSFQTERSDIPAEIESIFRKCLAVSPRDRYHTAAALAQALLLNLS